jgi:hypothetical protein
VDASAENWTLDRVSGSRRQRQRPDSASPRLNSPITTALISRAHVPPNRKSSTCSMNHNRPAILDYLTELLGIPRS